MFLHQHKFRKRLQVNENKRDGAGIKVGKDRNFIIFKEMYANSSIFIPKSIIA